MAILNVYAHEIQRGDYLHHFRDSRGGSGMTSGSSYVQAVRHYADTVEILTAAGIHDNWTTYSDTAAVWIDRD